jgi:chain length determinant protein tyrosine kinase EpsG
MSATHEKLTVHPASTRASAASRQLGALLVDMGKLKPDEAEQVLRAQKDMGLRFGDAAVKLGFVTDQDVQQALARQYEYPYVLPGESSISEEVIAAYQPFSFQVEQLRALRSQLLLRWFGEEEERRALSVLSPGRGEGRSYLAANLAVVFSQLGEHTLLIDADMRNPRQHALFGVANSIGLSTVLSGRAGIEAIHRIPALLDLSVLPAGPTPPNPAELVARSQFIGQLAEVVRQYDVVIVDSPAATLGADAQTIAVRTSGALMVARNNATRLADVQALRDSLASASAQVVGVVLNDF